MSEVTKGAQKRQANNVENTNQIFFDSSRVTVGHIFIYQTASKV